MNLPYEIEELSRPQYVDGIEGAEKDDTVSLWYSTVQSYTELVSMP